MNSKRAGAAPLFRAIAALVLAMGLPYFAAAADEDAARAVELYDAANYSEARELLERLDAKGEAGGALLYRLYYCQRATGDAKIGTETLRRAVEQLEQETQDGAGLESAFYLATGYENLGRKQEASAVSAAILDRVEKGEIEPSTGLDRFRLGKLYADQGKEIEAANWYRSSVQTFNDEGSGNSAYIVWASRYLADRALEMEDYSAAEMHLTDLVEHSRPTMEDLDRLAVARVRNGMYAEASQAWRDSIPLNPAQSNRARYCAQLARTVSRMKGEMLETAPSGKAWDAMSRDEMEGLLKAQAEIVREAKTEYAQGGMTDERLAEWTQSLKAAKAVFTTAGLEFALQGYDIREAAFLGGYAPLVFRGSEWRLVPREPKPGTRKKRRAESEQPEQGADPTERN